MAKSARRGALASFQLATAFKLLAREKLTRNILTTLCFSLVSKTQISMLVSVRCYCFIFRKGGLAVYYSPVIYRQHSGQKQWHTSSSYAIVLYPAQVMSPPTKPGTEGNPTLPTLESLDPERS